MEVNKVSNKCKMYANNIRQILVLASFENFVLWMLHKIIYKSVFINEDEEEFSNRLEVIHTCKVVLDYYGN